MCPYAAMSSASARPWSFFRRRVTSPTSGNMAAAKCLESSFDEPDRASPSACFHACGLTTSTVSPAAARTPFHKPKLYPCTNAVCAEKPYSTPPSSRKTVVRAGMFSDVTSCTMSSTQRRLRNLPLTSTLYVGQSWTSTEATQPRDGPRTTASAPPASESHPNRVHGSPPEGFNVRSFSSPGVVVVVAAMGRSNAERFLPRRVP